MTDVTDLPPFIVLRPAPDLPPGILPPEMEGVWYDREDLQVLGPDQTVLRLGGDVVFVAVAIDRTETDPERPPGQQTAQVFEVRP